jgi:hypothetical protein
MTRPRPTPRTRPLLCRRGGFAAVVAIVLLGLVGATLVVLATTFVGEATRTRTHAAQAQARQLLIAGQMIARASGDDVAAGKAVKVELPPSLVTDGAKLTISGAPENVHIDAQFQTSFQSQLITLKRSSSAWTVASATLDPQP